MREKLAYIEKIKSLSPIKDADRIEKVEVLGWELVCKKGEFKVGDLCVYVEIDSVLPELPCFEFLRPKKFRIRTVKLKGQISQGIAFPLSILTDVDPAFDIAKVKIGQDITEALRITKYDPEAALEILEPQPKKTWWRRKIDYLRWKLFGYKAEGARRGDYPVHIVPKTDEVRVQHMGGMLERNEDKLMYISEKIEGTSATVMFRKTDKTYNWISRLFGAKSYIFQACSRNRIVYDAKNLNEPKHHIFDVVKKYDLQNKMRRLDRNIAIQGEVIGPKIQGNIYKLPELDIRVFLIWDIDKQQYVSFDDLHYICGCLDLPTVPFIDYYHELKNDIKHYVNLSKGKSAINSSVLREGIVIRAHDNSFSFKAINPEYLLHQELKVE